VCKLKIIMGEKLPPIYFYIPQSEWPAGNIPDSPDAYWQWSLSSVKYTPYWGQYNWTLQTYLYLKADGFPCELTETLPSEGIVIAHKDFFSEDLQPGSRLLIVCIKADRWGQHAYAQFHIVQNPEEETLEQPLTFGKSYYMPHWPQSGLIPRSPDRGDRFENITYIGDELNLAPQLREPSWQEQLESLGLHWHVANYDRWNDYSEIDAIVAARSFKHQDHAFKKFTLKKPALKLHNAWHAGVPAILGCETAFQAERKSELDYIEVTSPADVISALKRLRDDKGLRQAMVENGRVRAEETQPARITKRWRSFLTDIATPAYDRWCAASNWDRQAFLLSRYLILKKDDAQLRLRKLLTRSL
jgi:hypothetical protein